jgi:hypothetical protein
MNEIRNCQTQEKKAGGDLAKIFHGREDNEGEKITDEAETVTTNERPRHGRGSYRELTSIRQPPFQNTIG